MQHDRLAGKIRFTPTEWNILGFDPDKLAESPVSEVYDLKGRTVCADGVILNDLEAPQSQADYETLREKHEALVAIYGGLCAVQGEVEATVRAGSEQPGAFAFYGTGAL